tara:strand:- start:1675 stop:2760 length:1086 start_codon:yes stop_codon:yes gene_type:complete
MIKNKLIILTSITIAVIVAATIFANLRAPQSQKEKTPFFPELAKQIESVNYISIKGYSDSINLTRKNNIWGIDEFDGYPALADKIKSTVLGAADLKINAPKTTLPRLYHRLGVEGPGVEGTNSLLLALYDSNKNKIIELIVGRPRLSSSAKNISGLYVRKPEDKKSYLVDGVLGISSIKTDWIRRNLFDIPAESIKSVNVAHYDGDSYTLYKNEKGQEQFELENISIGRELASELIINRFGTILQDLQISGAKSKELLREENKNTKIIVTTFEGIVGNITAFKYNDIAYASFAFSYDEEIEKNNNEEEVKNEDIKNYITNLNLDTENWWFEIPEFKYDIIKRRLNTITRDIQSIGPEELTE